MHNFPTHPNTPSHKRHQQPLLMDPMFAPWLTPIQLDAEPKAHATATGRTNRLLRSISRKSPKRQWARPAFNPKGWFRPRRDIPTY